MFWPRVFIIASHSLMFGAGIAALGPYLTKSTGSAFNDIDLNESWKQSMATALTLLGAMISALLTSIPTSILGFKKMLAVNSIIWFVAGACILPKNLPLLFIGRFILGIGVGFASTLAPVLLAEIAHPSQKGFVTSMHQLAITFCIFLLAIVSYWMFDIKHGWWYINCIFIMAMGGLMFCLNFLLVESPTWLLKNGREAEALEVLRSLRQGFDYQSLHKGQLAANDPSMPLLQTVNDSARIDPALSGLYAYDLDHLKGSPDSTHSIYLNQELQELKNQLSSGASETEITWGEIFTARYRKQILFGVALMLSSSLTGINAVNMFATKILGFAGLKDEQTIYGTIGIGFACFFMSFVAMLTIERFGRKTLFVTGAGGCLSFLLVLSISLLTLNKSKDLQGIIAIIGVIGYIMAFNTGLGGVPWCLLPEITASKVRNKLQSLFCFVNWLGNFIMVFITLPVVEFFGGGTSADNEKQGAAILFLIFAIFAVLALLFGVFFLIETKGKSETQIQLQLGNDEASYNNEVDPLLA